MILLCGQKVGVMALKYFRPKYAVCYDDITKNQAERLGIKSYPKMCFIKNMKSERDLLSVHGREIVKKRDLKRFDCLNIHPYLYCYKGKNPIGRAIKEKNARASVGIHRMTEDVDCGDVLFETFKKIKIYDSHEKMYEQLYELYLKCFDFISTEQKYDFILAD